MNRDVVGWTESSAIERAVVRTLVSDLLDGATSLPTAAVFSAVCDVMVSHFSLTHARLFTRVAGRPNAFAWTCPGVPRSRVMRAQSAVASATVSDVELGLSAKLYIASGRALDGGDHTLLAYVLHRMLCVPSPPDE